MLLEWKHLVNESLADKSICRVGNLLSCSGRFKKVKNRFAIPFTALALYLSTCLHLYCLLL